MKKSNNSTMYLEVPETIYNSIPEGEVQVHVYDAEIVSNDKVKGIKLFCQDVDWNEGEYLIFYSSNANQVYGQLIRAISTKKVTRLQLSKIIGKQLFVNIEENKGYRNITSIERISKSEYFEFAEEEEDQNYEENQEDIYEEDEEDIYEEDQDDIYEEDDELQLEDKDPAFIRRNRK